MFYLSLVVRCIVGISTNICIILATAFNPSIKVECIKYNIALENIEKHHEIQVVVYNVCKLFSYQNKGLPNKEFCRKLSETINKGHIDDKINRNTGTKYNNL